MQQMIGEFAPAELAEIGLGAAIGPSVGSAGVGDGVPDLAWADLAEMEMRREPRCRVDIEPAAIVCVVREPILDEGAESRQGVRFARLPGVAQAFRPIRLGRQKLQGFEPVALGVSEAHALRLRQRHARRSRREARLPERCEHAIGLAVAGDDRFRLEQQSPAEGTKLSPARAANLAYGLLQFRLPGLIAAGDMDCARAGLVEQRS